MSPSPNLSPSATSALPPSFIAKKKHILQVLSTPTSEYYDDSPKGSIDDGIRELIDEINGIDGYVTTSSCSGRIAIFLEGQKPSTVSSALSSLSVEENDQLSNDAEAIGRDSSIENEQNGAIAQKGGKVIAASTGGKGGGGKWLFVSHDPLDASGSVGELDWVELLDMIHLPEGTKIGLQEMTELRLIHFKFEPMILHVLTASLNHAQVVLSAALQSGFRESGALNLTSSSQDSAAPMVGIRSMGLAFESVIGYQKDGTNYCMIPNWQLENLLAMSNRRFGENGKRIARFSGLVKKLCTNVEGGKEKKGELGEWEDADVRRERKRREGLEKAEALKKKVSGQKEEGEGVKNSGFEFAGEWHTE